MLRMEIALFLVAVLVHLALDGCTVNHLDTVPMLLNGALHRLVLGSMAAVIYISTSPFWCRRKRASPGGWTGRRRRFW